MSYDVVLYFFFFFFFQAEDGIRDLYVTGVQTCALPISGSEPDLWRGSASSDMHDLASCGDAEWIQCFDGYHNTEYDRPRNGWARAEAAADLPSPGRSAGTHKDIVADRDDYPSGEIGRAHV